MALAAAPRVSGSDLQQSSGRALPGLVAASIFLLTQTELPSYCPSHHLPVLCRYRFRNFHGSGCTRLNKESFAAQENHFVESLCSLVFYFLQLLNMSFPVMHKGLYCRHRTENEVHTSTALAHDGPSRAQGAQGTRRGLLPTEANGKGPGADAALSQPPAGTSRCCEMLSHLLTRRPFLLRRSSCRSEILYFTFCPRGAL